MKEEKKYIEKMEKQKNSKMVYLNQNAQIYIRCKINKYPR